MPRLTVLLPVYNGLPYLQLAIQSICVQRFTDFELLLLDDGSTDGSSELMAEMAARDARLRVVRRERLGLQRILNVGLELASTEFVARMDADDMALPDRLALQMAYLEKFPQCVAVGGQVEQIDADGDPLGPFPSPIAHAEIESQLWTGRGSALVHSTAVFRRAALDAVGGYDESLSCGEDLDLYLKLAEIGTLSNLGDVVQLVRRHVSSTSALDAGAARADAARRQALTAAQLRRGLRPAPLQLHAFSRPASPSDLYYHWACRSAVTGHRRTAWKYAVKLLRAAPYALATWRRLAVIGGYLLAGMLPRSWRDCLRRRRKGAPRLDSAKASPTAAAFAETCSPAASSEPSQ